jgi:radical SAM superfamily enzyme YgiQ (UPF0313 family)
MIKNKIADAVIFGEGEQIIKDILADKIWGLHRVDQLKLEEWQYSYPNYDDFDLSRYTERQDQPSLGITGSKGCVRRCTFCDVVSLWPKYNFRTGKDVAQELITNYERYGIKRFQFSDSLMNGSITAFREMNEEIVARIPNKITYVGQYIFRPKKHVKEHDYDMMKKAGAHEFFIGVESGSERVRDHMKKKFSNDDIDFTARCLGERGIKQRWLFILGYPTETEEDFEDTISLLRRFGYLARQGLLNLAVRIYYNYPGAPLYDELAFHNIADAINPYFWTAEINPDMDFEARYQRLRKYINVAIQEGYFTGDDDEDIVNVLAEYNRARERYWQLKNAS